MHYRPLFTNKQMDVFALIIEGRSREQIEQTLVMTKEALLQNIYRIRGILGLQKSANKDQNDQAIRDHFFNTP